jgi:hypothetical protein
VAAAVALVGAVAAAGCGFGSGASAEGEARLTVTRDFGAEQLLEASVSDPPSSETVVRFLDREAEIETSFGGNFVDEIDGISGRSEDGRRSDWFFYVNGYWSPVGAAEARVRPGDRIWWDYRDWEAAYRVPAVVGSWPEPFASGFDGERFPTTVICSTNAEPCADVVERLEEAGAELARDLPARADEERVDPSSAEAGGGDDAGGRDDSGADESLRVLVGPWERLLEDPAAKLILSGPEASGVYASFEPVGESWELVPLDARGRERDRLGAGAGLVAALRVGEQQPTWLVTGTDVAGVEAAVALLSPETLEDRYALATDPGGGRLPLPVVAGAAEG